MWYAFWKWGLLLQLVVHYVKSITQPCTCPHQGPWDTADLVYWSFWIVFFQFFHLSHPFVLPFSHLLTHATSETFKAGRFCKLLLMLHQGVVQHPQRNALYFLYVLFHLNQLMDAHNCLMALILTRMESMTPFPPRACGQFSSWTQIWLTSLGFDLTIFWRLGEPIVALFISPLSLCVFSVLW